MTITYSYAGGALCKPCSRCGVVKPLSSYYKYGGKRASQYYSRCKACWAAQCAAYEATHKEQRHARTKAWRAAHPERVADWRAAWRARRAAQGPPRD